MIIKVSLIRADISNAKEIWQMQKECFAPLYEKYHDTDTSPATEALDKVQNRLKQDFTYYYFIVADGKKVGAVRIIDRKDNSRKRISPLFVIPKQHNKEIAQTAIRLAEELHGTYN